MVKKRPVTIWTTKQRPSNEPKFHQIERLFGAGKSITALFAILAKGWDLRMGIDIVSKWA